VVGTKQPESQREKKVRVPKKKKDQKECINGESNPVLALSCIWKACDIISNLKCDRATVG
jgi:hypothetical protein